MPTVFREIVDKGVQFDRHYVATSLCCPSRSEILTGLFEQNSGVDGNDRPLVRPTIVNALRNSGYRTAIAGKFLNSHPCATRRAEFDLWVCQGTEGSSYSALNPRLNVNGAWKSHTGVAPEILANYLKDFVATTPVDQPFFAMYTPTSPHMPADDPRYASMPVTPPRGPSWNEDTTAANKPAYTRIPPLDAALVRGVDDDFVRMSRAVRGLDDSVKTILDSLGPRADNTLVVYLSDNGYLFGEHRGHFKEAAYEESVNTPMVVRYPSAIPASLTGTASQALVQNIDLAPTFAQQAGIAWHVDGTSLMPLLTGAATSVRSAALIEHCEGPSYPCGVPRRQYLGVGFFNPPSFFGIVEQRFKYVTYPTGDRELYDLRDDPYELANLAGRPEWTAEQSRLDAALKVLTATHAVDTTLYFASDGTNGGQPAVRTVGFQYFANNTTATFVCRLARDGAFAAWAPCASNGFAANGLADGEYTFAVAAVDQNGAMDPTPETRSFGIHGVGPVFTIGGPPALTRRRSGVVSFSTPASVTNVQCQLSTNGLGAWQSCDPAAGFAYNNLADARWTFRVRATSASGVRTTPPSELGFQIDNIGPIASFTSAPSPMTASQSAAFTYTFSEATAGDVTCLLDGGVVPCGSRTFTASGLSEGQHSFLVAAIDPRGAWGTSTFTWVIDRTRPTVTAGGPSGSIGPNPAVQLSANEPVKWIFSLDGGAKFDGDPSFMFLYSLADGPHTLRSFAYDAAGNVSSVVTQSWTQKPVPSNTPTAASAAPVTTINEGPSGATPSGIAGFAFSADQPGATFECSLDNGGYGTCASPAVYEDLPAGAHSFGVRARAGAHTGLPATRTWSITT